MVLATVEIKAPSGDISAAIKSAIAAALAEMGNAVCTSAKARCPVRTGNLRDSLEVQPGDGYVDVGTAVDYGKYVELGTCRMRAQPYLMPALEENQGSFGDILAKHLGSLT